MDKDYNQKEIEEKWKEYWKKEDLYKFNPKSNKKVFSIDSPPPYASSGHLHVGHALHYTQFEIIARAMRLLGYEVYFAPSFDDNGLPTEKYVEEKYKINKAKTSRVEFRKICLKESKEVEKAYTENVFKKLGHSYDWDLLYQTISPEAQKVTQTAFLKLIKKGECYRAKEPTIWCPYHETALAQAEVEDLKRTTKLNYIEFGGEEKILIATTRPELLPVCVGIFVHPEDKRYKKLIGKEIEVPIFNYKVKVMTDKKVDMDFGTGIMMVCTFGDNADIEKWKKYNLDLKICIDEKGKLNKNAGKFAGLDLKEAREKILEELKKQGRLKKQEELEQTVGSCWRCNTPIEYIVKDQWVIRTLKHKKKLLDMGKKVKWHPDFMRTRYEDWVNNLSWDWVISRQRYYGVPIPVWYCNNCNEYIFPEEEELPIDPIETEKICPKCNKKAEPDKNVFDTWMTSSNTPEIALRWLEKPKQYKKLTPMSLRPQAYDIIRTWAFYTIIKSHLLFDRIPWKDIIIGTYVLDNKGKGMHKSKGNAIWIDGIIQKYNVDSFRYWVGSANLGSDLIFKENEIIAGQRFLTKLWNASRFILLHLKDYKIKKPQKIETMDKWLLQKLSESLKNTKKMYLSYNIVGAKREIEKFFWNILCDNYIEIIKNRIYSGNPEEKNSALFALYHALIGVLKMTAPIVPFITEEIYQQKFSQDEKCKSIHVSKWPELDLKKNNQIEEVGEKFLELLAKIRHEKSKAQKSIKAEIILTLEEKDLKKIDMALDDFKSVTSSKEIKKGDFKIEFT